MKKHILISIVAVLFSCITMAQDDWKPSSLEGFGHNSNTFVNALNVFNNQLYAATGNDSGYVYRSINGHPGSWQKVFDNANSSEVVSFASTSQGGGFMYLSSHNSSTNTSNLFRSADGTNWIPYLNSDAFSIKEITPFSFTTTNDSIYIISNIAGGSAICRSAYDGNDPNNILNSWDTVLNVSDTNDYTFINSVHKFNNTLYAGTSNNNHYLFYSGNGNTWITDTLFQPNRNNLEITTLGSFGGYLYIGTKNFITGPELWRTNDNINYSQITSFPGFVEITSINDINGMLWISLQNSNVLGGGKIIKSNDGINFSDSNSDGFNIRNNFGEKGSMLLFSNNIYYGCGNDIFGRAPINLNEGGQIWRYCLGGTSPIFSLGADVATCTGNSVVLNAGVGFMNYFWNTTSITQTISPTISGNYLATVADANQCASTDTLNVNFYPLPETLTFSAGDTSIVCKGNSLNIDINETEFSRYAVKLDGSGAFIKSANYTSLMNSNESFTFELWFKANAAGVLVNETDSTGNNWNYSLLEIDTAGNIIGRVQGLSEINMGQVNFSQWNYAALRYDKANLKLEGFLNGLISLSFQAGDRIAPWENGYSQLFNIGEASSNFVNTGVAFTGQIGEVRIWNYPRLDADIVADLNNVISSTSNGLVANYLMNSGTGNMAFDSSSNSLNDSLIGSAYFVSPALNSWSPFANLNSSVGNSVVAIPTTTTTYTITSTSYFGCASNASITIVVPSIQVNNPIDSVCFGNSIQLSASGGNNYYWSPTTALSDSTGATITAFPLTNIVYFVSDTIEGCFVKDSTTITVNPLLTASAGGFQIVCSSDNVILNSSASGGTPNYTYNWNNGISSFQSASIILQPTISTTYTITINDSVGCSALDTASIIVLPLTNIYGHASFSGMSDTSGIAVLYDFLTFNTSFTVEQVCNLNGNGDYQFTNIHHGNYLIKIFPNTLFYPDLAPTYYNNTFLWDFSTGSIINHNCINNDTLNIEMNVIVPTAGPGIMRGRIIEGQGFRNVGDPIPGLDVKLGIDPNGGLAFSTTTSDTSAADHGGYFYFSNIGIGNYIVYVDIPGLYRDSSYHVSITASNFEYIYLDYIADSNAIYIVPNAGTGIYTSEKNKTEFSIFPNPSTGLFCLKYSLNEAGNVDIKITDVLGKTLQTVLNKHQVAGNYLNYLSSEKIDLNAGVYFITLNINGKMQVQPLVIVGE